MGTPPIDFCAGGGDFSPLKQSDKPLALRASELDCDFDTVFDKIKFLFQCLEKHSEGITGEVKPIGEIHISAEEKKLHQTINHLIAAYTLAVAFNEEKSCFKVKEWTKEGVKIVDDKNTSATLPIVEKHIRDGSLDLSQVIKDLIPLMKQSQLARIRRGTCGEEYDYNAGNSDPKPLPGYFNKNMEWIQHSDLSPELQARDNFMRGILAN